MKKMKIKNFIYVKFLLAIKFVKIKNSAYRGFLASLIRFITVSMLLFVLSKMNLHKVPIHFFLYLLINIFNFHFFLLLVIIKMAKCQI